MPLPRWLLCCWVLGLPLQAAARDWRPCRPDEPAYQQADRELEALNTEVSALAPGVDVKRLAQRIWKLTASRCLEMAEGMSSSSDVDPSALALKTYWAGGGYAHLRSYLDLGKPGKITLREPPSLRETLGIDKLPPGHRLHALVCPPDDDRCGAETIEWTARAQGVLGFQRGTPSPSAPEECGAFASKGARRLRFERFTGCLAALRRSQPALPVGRLRAPREGWLTISRRRHHDLCGPQVRAFGLSTGATVALSRCNGLARGQHEEVDFRRVRVELGYVSVGAIREAAWMLLMLDAIEPSAVLEGVAAELPASIGRTVPRRRPRIPDPNQLGGRGSGHVSGGGRSLSWKVHLPGLAAGGELSWPTDDDQPGVDHADDLLDAAEASFVAGCPRVAPPPGLLDDGHRWLPAADWRRALAELEKCRTPPAPSRPP